MAGFNFAPRGWAFCNGQLLSIAENSALFSLLGTNFGGNGIQTFGLPDLRGRAPIHFGQGSGLTNRTLGETGGSENVTLSAAQMPQHSHATTLPTSASVADSATPGGRYLAKAADGESNYAAAPDTSSMTCTAAIAGGSQPHGNMPPFQVVNFIIAVEGIYPSRP